MKLGFTLVEVLVVVVIVGVLASVGVPMYYAYVQDSEQNLMQNTLAEGANFASTCLGSGGKIQYLPNPNHPHCFLRSGDTSSYLADSSFVLNWSASKLTVSLRDQPTTQISKLFR